jgi:hypothetical protein
LAGQANKYLVKGQGFDAGTTMVCSRQGQVILSHITLKFHYFSEIMNFSRYDATKFINSVAALRESIFVQT